MRSSEDRAACSEAARSANAVSISVSIVLSAPDSWPTSVRGSATGTRWVRSPAAICAAVCSTARSGRRLARTTT